VRKEREQRQKGGGMPILAEEGAVLRLPTTKAEEIKAYRR